MASAKPGRTCISEQICGIGAGLSGIAVWLGGAYNAAMSITLAEDARDHALFATCDEIGCGRTADLSPEIIERYGYLTIDEVRRRLRCSACGSKRVRLMCRPQREPHKGVPTWGMMPPGA